MKETLYACRIVHDTKMAVANPRIRQEKSTNKQKKKNKDDAIIIYIYKYYTIWNNQAIGF